MEPLACGLLSGKYRSGVTAPAGSRHLAEWDKPPVHDEEKLCDAIEVAAEIGKASGLSAAQVSLAYVLAKPAVTSLIVEARTTEQLRDNLAAADLELSHADIARLDQFSGEPLRYPYWHQAKTSATRCVLRLCLTLRRQPSQLSPPILPTGRLGNEW